MKIRMVTLTDGRVDKGTKIPFKNKLFEADSNPYFIMYENILTKERNDYPSYSLSSYDLIQRKKQGLSIAPEKNGTKVIILQSNDLVYVPTKEETQRIKNGEDTSNVINSENLKNISERTYIVNNFTKTDIYFKPNRFSKAIKSKELHTSYDDKCSRLIVTPQKDDKENDITEEAVLIKECCIKLNVDRLGNIKPA